MGLREAFTMGGRYPLVRYDDAGNRHLGAGGRAMVAAGLAMLALLLRLAHALLAA